MACAKESGPSVCETWSVKKDGLGPVYQTLTVGERPIAKGSRDMSVDRRSQVGGGHGSTAAIMVSIDVRVSARTGADSMEAVGQPAQGGFWMKHQQRWRAKLQNIKAGMSDEEPAWCLELRSQAGRGRGKGERIADPGFETWLGKEKVLLDTVRTLQYSVCS